MHRLLAEFMADWKKESPYNRDGDWIFSSTKLKRQKPESRQHAGARLYPPGSGQSWDSSQGRSSAVRLSQLAPQPSVFLGARPNRPKDRPGVAAARERQDHTVTLRAQRSGGQTG